MSSSIVIYGQNGQLGAALASILKNRAVVFASSEYDFSNIENIRNALKGIDAEAVINAAAYTDVNKAQSEENQAYKANALIPEALAKYCFEKKITFVHYSTDYVFSGDGNLPNKENQATAPLNVYGVTKLAGEEIIKHIGGKYLIFRTSWVYDSSRKNFLTTMLKLGAQRETLRVVADQYGAPTYAPHLAAATLEILHKLPINSPFTKGEAGFPSGVYNLCGGGEVSWHGFAVAIFKQARNLGITLKIQDVIPITSDEFVTPAKRPKNSRLDCKLAEKTFNVKLPDWQDGLNEALNLIVGENNETGKNAP